MKILSIDTSQAFCSVALFVDGSVVHFAEIIESSKQAEKLFSLIEECLTAGKLTIQDIDYIAVCNGPGSFTGIRIGLASAIGLSLGSKARILPVTSFEALSIASVDQGKIFSIIDASRGEAYIEEFDKDFLGLGPKTLKLEELKAFDRQGNVIIGNLKEPEFLAATYIALTGPNAILVGRYASRYTNRLKSREAQPLYIRDTDVTVKKK